ncbi:hypothetical protein [Xanthomonas translucens]|uniref:hypothetical protein n=1 Tax=Xanthomonas campestris pv. translucens TaxID=343 RepID=UPI0019D521F4|nr:hypothetical protein [Xanthomonas translucens]QSQ38906.1 hypothetical protein ISN32_05450 [Xanthomonas translucens pv. translucens]
MAELIALIFAPTVGGALLHRMWIRRAPRRRYTGLTVGEIPQLLRRRRAMAVRRGVAYA